MKSMIKLWIEAQSYYHPIWWRPLPAKPLARHYCTKGKRRPHQAFRCAAGGLWEVGRLRQQNLISASTHRKMSALQPCSPPKGQSCEPILLPHHIIMFPLLVRQVARSPRPSTGPNSLRTLSVCQFSVRQTTTLKKTLKNLNRFWVDWQAIQN